MFRGVVCLLVLACWMCPETLDAQVSEEWKLFEDFMSKFKKEYRDGPTGSVAKEKFKIFQDSLKRQEELNMYEAEKGGLAVYGVNKFSDLTPNEFKETYLTRTMPTPPSTESSKVALTGTQKLPLWFDWRDHGVVTSVRNQKKCGSCWAFAIVETIESKYAIDHLPHHELYELSPQQLISCEVVTYLDGCDGGVLVIAFDTLVKDVTTIVKASTYPFVSGDGKQHACKSPLPNVGIRLDRFHYNESLLNETEMKILLLNYSPLTTSVNAIGWQDYIGGIIQHHCTGSHQYIDHAVQVVGYNMSGVVPYWIVRNTWGKDWGENGYVRLKFGSNMCGIAQEVAAVLKVTGVNL